MCPVSWGLGFYQLPRDAQISLTLCIALWDASFEISMYSITFVEDYPAVLVWSISSVLKSPLAPPYCTCILWWPSFWRLTLVAPSVRRWERSFVIQTTWRWKEWEMVFLIYFWPCFLSSIVQNAHFLLGTSACFCMTECAAVQSQRGPALIRPISPLPRAFQHNHHCWSPFHWSVCVQSVSCNGGFLFKWLFLLCQG